MSKSKEYTSELEDKEEITSQDFEAQSLTSTVAGDTWTEVAYVSIAPIGYGELKFETLTETIDFDIGEKGVEFIPTLKGGRLAKFTPMDATTITMELYPTRAGTTGWPAAAGTKVAAGVFDLFGDGIDSTTPLSYDLDGLNRTKVRLCALWTDQASIDSAALTAITTTSEALRLTFAEGFMTKVSPSFTDGVLKFSVTLKFPSTNASGTDACKAESTAASAAGLVSLGSYTTGTMFV